MDFAVSVNHRVKVKKKQKERQVLRPFQRTNKAMEHEGDSDTNLNGRTWNGLKSHGKGNERLGIRG